MWISALQFLARSHNLLLRGERALQPYDDVRQKLFFSADCTSFAIPTVLLTNRG